MRATIQKQVCDSDAQALETEIAESLSEHGAIRRVLYHKIARNSMHPHINGTSEHDPLWYKDAIIYEAHVRAFHDSNADGMGDFRGLAEKLDYLEDLGVTAIWLLPFSPRLGRMTATTSRISAVFTPPTALCATFSILCARRTGAGCVS